MSNSSHALNVSIQYQNWILNNYVFKGILFPLGGGIFRKYARHYY